MSYKKDVFCEDCEYVGLLDEVMYIENINCLLPKNSKMIKSAIRIKKVFGRCIDCNKNNNCEDYKKRS